MNAESGEFSSASIHFSPASICAVCQVSRDCTAAAHPDWNAYSINPSSKALRHKLDEPNRYCVDGDGGGVGSGAGAGFAFVFGVACNSLTHGAGAGFGFAFVALARHGLCQPGGLFPLVRTRPPTTCIPYTWLCGGLGGMGGHRSPPFFPRDATLTHT